MAPLPTAKFAHMPLLRSLAGYWDACGYKHGAPTELGTRPTFPCGQSSLCRFAFGATALNGGSLCQLAVNAGDTFDLAFGRKTLVKTFVAEIAEPFGPGREALTPPPDAVIRGIGVLGGQISTDAEHGFEGDRFCYHVIVVAPSVLKHLRGGFEEIADDGVIGF